MISTKYAAVFAAAVCVLVGCTTSTDTGGGLELVQFLKAGQAGIARNTELEFVFSAPVSPDQDLFERLKIQNVQTSPGQGNFSRAIGVYDVFGERVIFIPRYPEQPDRDDAGLYSNGSYHVFLKAGPDALQAVDGTRLEQQQEFLFDTSQYFEDPIPAEPPRAGSLSASDPIHATTTDISRLDPRPFQLSLMDSKQLLDAGRAIDPGADGFPYGTPWEFDLTISEPIDPQTVTESNIELWEVRHNALGDNNTPPDGWFGELVHYKFPVRVTCRQRYDADADRLTILIRVIPLGTLSDNARYRLILSGDILGIDFRKSFPGDNGLTGDGQTEVDGVPFDEVGGLGYVTEFLVYDRDPITQRFTLEYDPVQDGVYPEDGNTTNDPTFVNRVPYNSPAYPGNAVGLVPAFGDGRDGDFSVGGGQTVPLHTGDTPNVDVGNPFTVIDLDYQDTYVHTANPNFSALEGPRQYQRLIPTEWQFTNLTVSSASILDITGVNPARILVTGMVQISGTVYCAGAKGDDGSMATSMRMGGLGGAGGYRGGNAKLGLAPGYYNAGSCTSFQAALNQWATLKAGFPFSAKGEGPGRGGQGGEAYTYDLVSDGCTTGTGRISGTGGGGGGHGEPGGIGEDPRNAAGNKGDIGPACGGTMRWYTSSVKGLRGIGGVEYGDREITDLLAGGSGGGAGGAIHLPYSSTSYLRGSGGAGGGGGGALEILAAGPILLSGAEFDLRGGDGGQGVLAQIYTYTPYLNPTGGGGGGSGGAVSLVSGNEIEWSAATVDTRGGAGGLRANAGTTTACTAAAAGGAGGKGRILLMDKDGTIGGMIEGSEGDHDGYEYGKLAVRRFDANRFDLITSTTRPFFVGTADPAYQALDGDTDIHGTLLDGQEIKISMLSYQGDPNHPLIPNLDTESALIHVATAHFDTIQKFVVDVVPGAMSLLNTSGTPNRESFLRVHAEFEYQEGVQAATGPYALLDRVIITTRFND